MCLYLIECSLHGDSKYYGHQIQKFTISLNFRHVVCSRLPLVNDTATVLSFFSVVTDTLTGTATPGVDYSFIPVSKTESFNPNQDRRMFELQILNDDLIENAETIVLRLTVTDETRARVDATSDTMTVTINTSDQRK